MQSDPTLLTRAVVKVIPKNLAEERLRSGKQLRVYLGIDATGSRLHIGHSVPLRKLAQFADAGHHAILLIGSFTAMLGDPSGRDQLRKALTKEEVEANMQTYKQQASKIIDVEKVEIVYNDTWLEKLSQHDLIKIAGFFTKQQMEQREMFQKREREGNPIYVQEFLYPLYQGYDSVYLDVDGEIGATEQEFNMLAGRTLQKAFGKREKFILTIPILEGMDGRKMSKTYDNCVYLEDPPTEMYGKLMSLKDALITTYMECVTDIPIEEVRQAGEMMKAGINPKDVKMRLAREIVSMYHGKEAAANAEEEFTKVFSKKGVPEEMFEVIATKEEPLVDLLVRANVISSKSDARRLIGQKGIHLNDMVVTSIDAKVGEGLTPEALAKGVIVKVGKRRFLKIIF